MATAGGSQRQATGALRAAVAVAWQLAGLAKPAANACGGGSGAAVYASWSAVRRRGLGAAPGDDVWAEDNGPPARTAAQAARSRSTIVVRVKSEKVPDTQCLVTSTEVHLNWTLQCG